MGGGSGAIGRRATKTCRAPAEAGYFV